MGFLSSMRDSMRWLFDKMWRWDVVGIGSTLVYAAGVSAMYGSDYVIAYACYFVGIAWLIAKAVSWEETTHHKNRIGISALVLVVGVGLFAVSAVWITHHQGAELAKTERPAVTATEPKSTPEQPKELEHRQTALAPNEQRQKRPKKSKEQLLNSSPKPTELPLANCQPRGVWDSIAIGSGQVGGATITSFTTGGKEEQKVAFPRRPKRLLVEPPGRIIEVADLPTQVTLGKCGNQICVITVKEFAGDGVVVDTRKATVLTEEQEICGITVKMTVLEAQ